MSSATYRAPLGGLGLRAMTLTLVLYFALKLTDSAPAFVAAYPLGFAALVGLARFLVGLRTHYLRRGIRVDAQGITAVESGVHLPWSGVQQVEIKVNPAPDGSPGARTVILRGDEQILVFGDASHFTARGALPDGVAFVGVANPEELLAIVAARTGSEALFPAQWKAPTDAQPTGVAESKPAIMPTPRWRTRSEQGVGLLALGFKLLPKVGSMALKLLKSVKPAAALVTVGAYSLIFSWKFALAFVGLIGLHECGHVYAMWRSGVGVKGIYFIPFVGGVAVSKGLAQQRFQSAYIALNGPVWGTVLAMACLAVFMLGDGAWPFVGALAAWGALLNLFNLLPIMPLDGGRVLSAVTSAASPWAAPVVMASLGLGGALAYFAELELLLLMVVIGFGELAVTLQAQTLARARPLLAPHTLDAGSFHHFARLLVPGGKWGDPAQRTAAFVNRLSTAAQTPMNARQTVAVFAVYAMLVAVLLGVIWVMRDLPGGGDPWSFLQ